jgi:RNA polymerase sigma-32 factor
MRVRESRTLGTQCLRGAAATRMLGAAEEAQLARAAQLGDEAAFAHLVAAHLRLVFKMVSECRGWSLPLDELTSEGVIGLVIACRRFDPERGTRLAPYAALWIRAYLRRYSLANRRIVRTPSTRSARKILAQLGHTRRQLAQQLGEMPSNRSVAAAIGVATEEVDEVAIALSARDVPYGIEVADRTFEAASELRSPEANALESEAASHSARRVEQALLHLAPRDRHILECRFLADRTLEDVGRELGISRERVRQLEARAKAQIHGALAPAATFTAAQALERGA